ncbi:kinase-like protein [Gyrodon lividus]|nr:kinase-like protein [Gyrodon lividus]
MVSPWLENGPLMSYLERRDDNLTTVERLVLLSDVAMGLQYLHSQSVVHGNLSGSNVFIHDNGRACIADFCLSMLLTEFDRSTFSTSQPCGALRWAAPELLFLNVQVSGDEDLPMVPPTPQSDIYSFGGIMLQVLTGKIPYHYYPRDEQVVLALFQGETPTRPSQALVTDGRWAFMQQCWLFVNNGQSRPSDDEIVTFIMDELVGEKNTNIDLLDRPAVAPIGAADNTNTFDSLHGSFFNNDSPGIPYPVDESWKKHFSKLRNKFMRKRKDREFKPQPVTTSQEHHVKDNEKHKESDPNHSAADDTDRASTSTPTANSQHTVTNHTKRQVRDRVARLRQAIMRRRAERDAAGSIPERRNSQLSSHADDPLAPDLRGSMGRSQNRHEHRGELTWISEARTRHIFAWETGPPPHEIERGCFFHFASYMCFGRRDPNVPPDENDVRPKSHFVEVLDQLFVRLRLYNPSATSPIAPLPTSIPLTPSSRGGHNGALAPVSNQSPVIVITPPTDAPEARVDPTGFPPSSDSDSEDDSEAYKEYKAAARAVTRCVDMFCNVDKVIEVALYVAQEEAARNEELVEDEMDRTRRREYLDAM